mgnify:CR=1 FL=1
MVPTVFKVGLTTMFPSVGASYQVKVIPTIGVMALLASNVCIGDNSHAVIFPVEIGAVGAGLIVKVTAVLE